jgi:hypothetical protein
MSTEAKSWAGPALEGDPHIERLPNRLRVYLESAVLPPLEQALS